MTIHLVGILAKSDLELCQMPRKMRKTLLPSQIWPLAPLYEIASYSVSQLDNCRVSEYYQEAALFGS